MEATQSECRAACTSDRCPSPERLALKDFPTNFGKSLPPSGRLKITYKNVRQSKLGLIHQPSCVHCYTA